MKSLNLIFLVVAILYCTGCSDDVPESERNDTGSDTASEMDTGTLTSDTQTVTVNTRPTVSISVTNTRVVPDDVTKNSTTLTAIVNDAEDSVFTYAWSVEECTGTFDNPNIATTTFTIQNGSVATTCKFTVVVTDTHPTMPLGTSKSVIINAGSAPAPIIGQ
jgi:uncharacterized protein YcfL